MVFDSFLVMDYYWLLLWIGVIGFPVSFFLVLKKQGIELFCLLYLLIAGYSIVGISNPMIMPITRSHPIVIGILILVLFYLSTLIVDCLTEYFITKNRSVIKIRK